MAATLTPGATTGLNVLFTASVAVFIAGDVGRLITYGGSRAVIISLGASASDTSSPNLHVRVDILDNFPDTNPIAAGSWFLRGAPQAALTPSAPGPAMAKITLTTDINAFRDQDLNRYILVYGGIVQIIGVTDPKNIIGLVVSPMAITDPGPGAAPAGAWTLEVPSWSTTNGFPRTGEFVQGRLAQASTFRQPTSFWMSKPNDYDNYGVGIKASDAIDSTIAARELTRLEWLVDRGDLFIGASGSELKARGGVNGEPLGGDVVPNIDNLSSHGSAPIQPVVVDGRIIFVDKLQTKIFSTIYDLYENVFDNIELTVLSDHITESGIKLGPVAYQKRPDPRLFFVRNDGQLITLTHYKTEKVIGFTRLVTDGFVEAVACIQQPDTRPDQIWVIVRRIVQGVGRRYIEVSEEDTGFTQRPWASAYTDCGVYYRGVPTQTITGLDHLEGRDVDVIAGGGFRGQRTVNGGAIDLGEDFSRDGVLECEVGLHYDSTVTTMRPAIQNSVIEGMPRTWHKLWARFRDTWNAKIGNSPTDTERVEETMQTLDNLPKLFTGDSQVTGQGWDTDGRVTVVQDQPYPMTLLAVFGTLNVGDHD